MRSFHYEMHFMEELTRLAFAGMSSMVARKSWTEAVRGLQMVAFILLEGFFHEALTVINDLQSKLDKANEN